MDGGSFAQLAYLLLLLAAVGGWVLVEYRGRMGSALRTAAAWGLIFIGMMAGYGLWTDMRVAAPMQAMISDGRVEIPRAPDGHYYLTLDISGQPVDFMVDTGATNMVLSQADAARVGVDPAGLVYLGEARTANGIVRTARVRLDAVTLGGWTDPRFPAWVTEGDLDGSLLGMDYLGLYRIEIAGDRMVLSR